MEVLRNIAPILSAAVIGAVLGMIVQAPYLPEEPDALSSDEWLLGEVRDQPLDNAYTFLQARRPWGQLQSPGDANSLSDEEAARAAAARREATWRFVGISREISDRKDDRRDDSDTGIAHFRSDSGESALIPVGEQAPSGGLITAIGRDWVEIDQDGEPARLRLFEPLASKI
jgi:hypothetical protein